jgi:hypothetical protein
MEKGDKIISKTPAGVEMGDVPTDGTYHQKRKVPGVFKSGVILEVRDSVIDYDSWDVIDEETGEQVYLGLGKVPYRDCYVENEAGIRGWVGEGALLPA